MLTASESGMASGAVLATYADGTSTTGQLLTPAWKNWPYPAGGDLIFTSYLTENSTNYNRTNIFQTINWLDSSKELVALTLPNSTEGASTSPGGASVDTKLHIFALSMLPVPAKASQSIHLETQYARSTQKWIEGTNKTQIIEVLVNNVGSSFALRDHSVHVTVESPGLKTVQKGTIKRLGPGDQAIVEIGVENCQGVAEATSGPATIKIKGHGVTSSQYTFEAVYGISPYDATYESVYSHESPSWYNNAKYGWSSASFGFFSPLSEAIVC